MNDTLLLIVVSLIDTTSRSVLADNRQSLLAGMILVLLFSTRAWNLDELTQSWLKLFREM